ncbi:unnamed protein product [Enterobius vermicularis]|uniref:EXOSC1 domain-containing protein n=1 Tax=Enterobius vermicularis TaxID=51028 RepID=A0A0N4V5E7_ENTVE|nr:unnamed protein product [Enterobius vermicularis]
MRIGVIESLLKVEYKAKRMKDLRRGLCSNFLSHLHPGDTVLAKVKAGTFRTNYVALNLAGVCKPTFENY